MDNVSICVSICPSLRPVTSGGACSEGEHKLFSVIFSKYNQFIRPVENVSEPVIVQFEVSMSQLVKVVRSSVAYTVRLYSAGIYGAGLLTFITLFNEHGVMTDGQRCMMAP